MENVEKSDQEGPKINSLIRAKSEKNVQKSVPVEPLYPKSSFLNDGIKLNTSLNCIS